MRTSQGSPGFAIQQQLQRYASWHLEYKKQACKHQEHICAAAKKLPKTTDTLKTAKQVNRAPPHVKSKKALDRLR